MRSDRVSSLTGSSPELSAEDDSVAELEAEEELEELIDSDDELVSGSCTGSARIFSSSALVNLLYPRMFLALAFASKLCRLISQLDAQSV